MRKPSIAELFCLSAFKFSKLLTDERATRIHNSFAIVICGIASVFSVVGWVADSAYARVFASLLFLVQLAFWFLVFGLKMLTRASSKSRKLPPSLKPISNFADFWGLDLRKRIKAVAGEFDVELKRLHKEKRYAMAKWNVVLAWGYAIWYVLRGPYDLLKGALVKALRGL